MPDLYERFEVDYLKQVIKSDDYLNNFFTADSKLENLCSTLLSNKSTPELTERSYTVADLVSAGFLRTEISTAISYGGSDFDAIYHAILYAYKYAAIKLFLKKNYRNFLPEYDYNVIQSEEKTRLLTEAFMHEYDRLCYTIDKIADVKDLNSIPTEYLEYLGQLIGYERKDQQLLNNSSFRELLVNIIDIYKIKGTNYSFELFMNLLGFDITVQEFYFDKRYGDPNIGVNPYTTSVDKKSYLFYLSAIKPTDYIPSGLSKPYSISENAMKDPMDLLMFNQYTDWYTIGDSRGKTYKMLIGDTGGYTGDTYTFFKTNVIQYSLSHLGGIGEAELTDADAIAIEVYAKFLTPIFISRKIFLAAAPYKETAGFSWTLNDADRTDPFYMGDSRLGYMAGKRRNYRIKSITKGDTYNPARVNIADGDSSFYKFAHVGDLVNLRIPGDSNSGSYYIYGDSYVKGDSHWPDGTTVVYLKSYWIKGNVADATATTSGDTLWYIQPNHTIDLTYTGDTSITFSIGGPDRMLHLYEGPAPSRYYWDRGVPRGYSAVIPEEAILFKLYDIKCNTSKGTHPTHKDALYYEADTLGTVYPFVLSPYGKWGGFGSNSFWSYTKNLVPSTNFGDSTKWLMGDTYFAGEPYRYNYYDSVIGKNAFQWKRGNFSDTTVLHTIAMSVTGDNWITGSFWFKATQDCIVYFHVWPGPLTSIGKGVAANVWTKVELSLDATGVTPLTSFGFVIARHPFDSTATFYATEPQVEVKPFATAFTSDSRVGSALYYKQKFGDSFSDFNAGDSGRVGAAFGDSGSIECWVRPWSNNNLPDRRYVFTDYITGDTHHMSLYYDPIISKWVFEVKKDGTNFIQRNSYPVITLNSWQYLKTRWIRSRKMVELYVGDSWQGDTVSAGNINPWNCFGDTIISIGSNPLIARGLGDTLLTVGLGDTSQFNGVISDFIYYTYADNTKWHFYRTTPLYQDNTKLRSGYFISGYHNNTYNQVFGDTKSSNYNATSIYQIIKNTYPSWNIATYAPNRLFRDELIFEKMSSLQRGGDTGLFNYNVYGLRNRDMLIIVDSDRHMRSKKRFVGDSIYDPKTKYAFGDTRTRLRWRADTKRLGDSWIPRQFVSGDSMHKGEHWIKYFRRSAASYLYYYIGDSKLSPVAISPGGDSSFWGARVGDSRVWERFGGFLNVVERKSDTLFKGNQIKLGANFPILSYFKRPKQERQIYGYSDNKAPIILLDADLDLATGKSVIQIFDPSGDYKHLMKNDIISVIGRADTFVSTYRVSDTTFNYGDTTVITVGINIGTTDFPYSPSYTYGYVIPETIGRIRTMRKNVGGFGEVEIFDTSRKFAYLKAGDTVVVMTGDTNKGTYVLDSNATYTPVSISDSIFSSADSFGWTTLVFTTVLNGNGNDVDGYGDSKVGFVRVNSPSWMLGAPYYDFDTDKINISKTQFNSIRNGECNDLVTYATQMIFSSGGATPEYIYKTYTSLTPLTNRKFVGTFKIYTDAIPADTRGYIYCALYDHFNWKYGIIRKFTLEADKIQTFNIGANFGTTTSSQLNLAFFNTERSGGLCSGDTLTLKCSSGVNGLGGAPISPPPTFYIISSMLEEVKETAINVLPSPTNWTTDISEDMAINPAIVTLDKLKYPLVIGDSTILLNKVSLILGDSYINTTNNRKFSWRFTKEVPSGDSSHIIFGDTIFGDTIGTMGFNPVTRSIFKQGHNYTASIWIKCPAGVRGDSVGLEINDWTNPGDSTRTRILGIDATDTWQNLVCKKQVGDSAVAAYVRLVAGDGIQIGSYFDFTDVALYER
jgi:hypothetical protein